eukprot:scaffold222232_cov16-Tisochrysis_lutea.AAC.2
MVNRRQVGKQGSQCIAGWEACCPCMAYAPAQCHGRQSTSNPALGILSSEAIGRYTHLPNERRGLVKPSLYGQDLHPLHPLHAVMIRFPCR